VTSILACYAAPLVMKLPGWRSKCGRSQHLPVNHHRIPAALNYIVVMSVEAMVSDNKKYPLFWRDIR
jgi:hypothetical protein